MSTFDLAFIRAYGVRSRSKNASAVTPDHSESNPADADALLNAESTQLSERDTPEPSNASESGELYVRYDDAEELPAKHSRRTETDLVPEFAGASSKEPSTKASTGSDSDSDSDSEEARRSASKVSQSPNSLESPTGLGMAYTAPLSYNNALVGSATDQIVFGSFPDAIPVASIDTGFVLPIGASPLPVTPSITRRSNTSSSDSTIKMAPPSAEPATAPDEQLPHKETSRSVDPTPTLRIDDPRPNNGHSPPKSATIKLQSNTWRPAWEVDRFDLSPACRVIEQHATSLNDVANSVMEARTEKKNVVSVRSWSRGEGRSTIAICLAWRLAKFGQRVLLIDGDFDNPNLVNELGISVEHGWEETLDGEIAFSEASVASVENGFTVLPLLDAGIDIHEDGFESKLQRLIGVASRQFDLVVVDMGPGSQPWDHRDLDYLGVIVVRDLREADGHGLQLLSRFQKQHTSILGIIENFSAKKSS